MAKKLRIPHFRGVLMLDQLSHMRPRRNESVILNLDTTRGDGTHWVAYYKRGNKTVYFDSFGDLRPPFQLERYLRDGSSSIVYNFEREQDFNTVVCGHLCLAFLIKAEGEKF